MLSEGQRVVLCHIATGLVAITQPATRAALSRLVSIPRHENRYISFIIHKIAGVSIYDVRRPEDTGLRFAKTATGPHQEACQNRLLGCAPKFIASAFDAQCCVAICLLASTHPDDWVGPVHTACTITCVA